jgi:hypothetical protein
MALTLEQVREIRALLQTGIPVLRIAKLYAVTHRAIKLIRLGQTWQHVA